MRNLVGRKVGMNDMWDAMCQEERKRGKGKERRKITEREENQQFSD